MAKAKMTTVYFCQNCGYESSKWMGQCPGCREWNTLVEEVVSKTAGSHKSTQKDDAVPVSRPQSIASISMEEEDKIFTHMEEFDRVLGGGIMPGGLVLVGGDPGIGKSTLLLQMCKMLSDEHKKVLYVSGEESLKQIKMRAVRIGEFTEDVKLFCETDLDRVETVILNEKPQVVVIDSIQTMFCERVSAAPGSVSQVREATGMFLRLAKTMGIAIFIVGHVTKEGTVAGPRVLEHMVDTVLYFEGDRHASYRILRSVKNRFGSTNEIGVFEMRREGLVEVKNPSEFMLDGRPEGASGSVVACAMEGTRPMLIEIQALVCDSNFQIPRRQTTGTDFNRVNLLMAVLEKRLSLHLGQMDAYVNLAGGMRLMEPALDLGIVMALISSFKNKPIGAKTVIFGEVGLSGEVRGVSMAAQRLAEAKKLGFQTCIMPRSNYDSLSPEEKTGIKIYGVANVAEAVETMIE
ncbi:MAG: DNA repair protein RadA [Lachnospiraceae bacterium]|nr:DNA repair protein RadA [Lachnospiraceae bacterium]